MFLLGSLLCFCLSPPPRRPVQSAPTVANQDRTPALLPPAPPSISCCTSCTFERATAHATAGPFSCQPVFSTFALSVGSVLLLCEVSLLPCAWLLLPYAGCVGRSCHEHPRGKELPQPRYLTITVSLSTSSRVYSSEIVNNTTPP